MMAVGNFSDDVRICRNHPYKQEVPDVLWTSGSSHEIQDRRLHLRLYSTVLLPPLLLVVN